jgi:hypothetical protein
MYFLFVCSKTEPKGKNSAQLREIYQEKLKLLERKYENDRKNGAHEEEHLAELKNSLNLLDLDE